MESSGRGGMGGAGNEGGGVFKGMNEFGNVVLAHESPARLLSLKG